jgi:Tfp pilus assembly protein PilO
MNGANEKKLLAVILAIGIILISYNYIYKPKQKANETMKQEIKILEERYNKLHALEIESPNMEKEVKLLKEEIEKYNSQYPAEFSQEETVMLVNYINQATNIHISNVSLSPFEIFYQEDAANGEIAYVTSVALNYTGSYSNVKAFFQYLKDYPKRVTLSSVSMSYNQEKNEITGELKINIFIIQSADSNLIGAPEYTGIIGKDSIIDQYIALEQNPEAEIQQKTAVELYASLTSPYADMAPVIIGVKGDIMGETEAKVNNNMINEVTIELSASEGSYYAQYWINGNSNGKYKLNVDTSIDIDVYSQRRADESDKVGMLAKIINNTDLAANLYVYNDDANAPRFVLESSVGVVNIVR